MNIEKLITKKTQILRNSQGAIVNGIAVEDLEAVINEIKAQGIQEAVECHSGIMTSTDGDDCDVCFSYDLRYFASKLTQQNKEQ